MLKLQEVLYISLSLKIMKKIVLLLIFFSTKTLVGQVSVNQVKEFDDLTKEDMFLMGQLYASNQYNDDFAHIAAGFFLGSLAIDGVSSFRETSDRKYKKWTRKIDLDEKILNNNYFSEGFVQKRKQQAITSMRKGRLIARSALTLGIILVLIDELDDDDDYYKKKKY